MDLWPVIWLQVKMLSRRGFVHYENADSVPEPEPAEITRGGPHSWVATQLAIICCTRCKIMTYMTVKEHGICILAAWLMFIAWFCSLRAGKIALGLLALQPQSAPAAKSPVRLLLFILVNLWVSSEASASVYTLWPQLQKCACVCVLGGALDDLRLVTFTDWAIIYAAALYTSTLYGTVLNCLGHHARDVKTPCLDILSTLMWCSEYIQCVCVIVHCQLIGNNYSYLWLFLH